MNPLNLKRAISWQGKMQPTIRLPQTLPMGLTSAQVRRTVAHFLETGVSSHSAMGGTLWALIDFLQRQRIPYTLTAYPGEGYEVRKAPHTTYPNAGPYPNQEIEGLT